MKRLSKQELETELDKLQTHGANGIQLFREDLNIFINREGLISMSRAEFSGKNAASEAMKSVISEFENDEFSTLRLRTGGILAHFKLHPDYPMMEVAEAMEMIYDISPELHYDFRLDGSNIVLCTSIDDSISENYVCVTVFVNEFEKLVPANNI